MNKPWKVILAFTGIFLAGVLVGGLVTLRVGRHFAQRLPMAEGFGPQLLGRLVTQLELTPEQQAKIKPIVDQAAEELHELRRTTQRSSAAVIVRMQGDISAQLTPAQKTKFDELVAQQRDRFKRFMEERGRHRGERPPAPR
jgi:Spy/CpxP family protein refolding chaperone